MKRVEVMSFKQFFEKKGNSAIIKQSVNPVYSFLYVPAPLLQVNPTVRFGYITIVSIGLISLGALKLERYLIKKGKHIEAEALNDIFKIALMTGFVVAFVWFCAKSFTLMWRTI